MGTDYRRAATDAERERMETLLLAELEAGALGLGTGLEYDPGIYSEPSEVLQLALQPGEGYGVAHSTPAPPPAVASLRMTN